MMTTHNDNDDCPSIDAQDAYLDLLAKVLTRYITGDRPWRRLGVGRGGILGVSLAALQSMLGRMQIELVKRSAPVDLVKRAGGEDWPVDAETMVGLERLANIKQCIRSILVDQIPGDLIETGVWRGGAVIYMRAVLKSYGEATRTVWAADSFQGLPRPNEDRYPADKGDTLYEFRDYLGVSVEEVQENFAKYGLLDDNVKFLVGWFRDTLPTAPIKSLALMRLDGDLYESTMDALVNLYPRLSSGGYVIIDDYGALATCRQAVHDFRRDQSIDEEIVRVDSSGVYWRKSPP